ncbi:MAG: DUF4383 domain-containing protein [Ktedonobacteraceae bacterium]
MVQQTQTAWTANRIFALVVGIVLLLLGIIGFFVPAENSTGVQAIFGIFDVDIVHNLFHVLSGIIGIAAAFTGWSRMFNRVFGVIYTLLGLLGLIPALYFPAGSYGHDNGLFLGLMHINAGDHILHLILGIAALAVSYMAHDYVATPVPSTVDNDTTVEP